MPQLALAMLQHLLFFGFWVGIFLHSIKLIQASVLVYIHHPCNKVTNTNIGWEFLLHTNNLGYKQFESIFDQH